MTGVPSDASFFPSFTLPTPTILTMGDLQQPNTISTIWNPALMI
jgi:hypothetical protein